MSVYAPGSGPGILCCLQRLAPAAPCWPPAALAVVVQPCQQQHLLLLLDWLEAASKQQPLPLPRLPLMRS